MVTRSQFNKLPVPCLPQRDKNTGILNVLLAQNDFLLVIIDHYPDELPHDSLIVHVGKDIDSTKFWIETTPTPYTIHIRIPFSEIPDGTYEVTYSVKDEFNTPQTSPSTSVTIIHSPLDNPDWVKCSEVAISPTSNDPEISIQANGLNMIRVVVSFQALNGVGDEQRLPKRTAAELKNRVWLTDAQTGKRLPYRKTPWHANSNPLPAPGSGSWIYFSADNEFTQIAKGGTPANTPGDELTLNRVVFYVACLAGRNSSIALRPEIHPTNAKTSTVFNATSAYITGRVPHVYQLSELQIDYQNIATPDRPNNSDSVQDSQAYRLPVAEYFRQLNFRVTLNNPRTGPVSEYVTAIRRKGNAGSRSLVARQLTSSGYVTDLHLWADDETAEQILPMPLLGNISTTINIGENSYHPNSPFVNALRLSALFTFRLVTAPSKADPHFASFHDAPTVLLFDSDGDHIALPLNDLSVSYSAIMDSYKTAGAQHDVGGQGTLKASQWSPIAVNQPVDFESTWSMTSRIVERGQEKRRMWMDNTPGASAEYAVASLTVVEIEAKSGKNRDGWQLVLATPSPDKPGYPVRLQNANGPTLHGRREMDSRYTTAGRATWQQEAPAWYQFFIKPYWAQDTAFIYAELPGVFPGAAPVVCLLQSTQRTVANYPWTVAATPLNWKGNKIFDDDETAQSLQWQFNSPKA